MKTLLNVSLALSFLLLQVSCGNHHDEFPEKALMGQDSEAGGDIVLGRDISFLDIKESIIDASCKSCHKEYLNYENVKRDSFKILTQVSVGSMPQFSAKLSEELITFLEEWVVAGAPEFGADQGAE